MNDSEIRERIRRDDDNIERKTNHRWEVMSREEKERGGGKTGKGRGKFIWEDEGTKTDGDYSSMSE